MDIHKRADELVRQSGGRLTHAQALAELGKRGARSRNYGRTRVKDDRARQAIEQPPAWWQKD